MDKVSAPPGFVSQTSFWLQSTEGLEDDCGATDCSHKAGASLRGASSSTFDVAELKNSFERKPWLLFHQVNCRNMESNGEQNKNCKRQPYLPRCVIRGCPDCSNCQKVSPRWRPEDAHTAPVEEAPVFYPTDEEFEDMPKYISNVRSSAESCGVCRIVPPHSWAQSCPVPEGDIWDNDTFTTQIQYLSELHVELSDCKPGKGPDNITGQKRKQSGPRFENGDTRDHDGPDFGSKRFGFDEGPELSVKAFKKYADDFRRQYFYINRKQEGFVSSNATSEDFNLTVNKIEGEYWRIIENPTERLEVLAGADLDTKTFGTKFHETTDSKLLKSGWNLQNTNKLTDSLLTLETNNASSVLFPRLYLGMCFSTLCWKVEDSLLYSLYYLHMGAPKVWYGIPGRYFLKFQAIVKKYYPDVVSKQPEMLYKLKNVFLTSHFTIMVMTGSNVTEKRYLLWSRRSHIKYCIFDKPSAQVRQLPISTLKSEGIPVYHCIQRRGEFVLIFPGSYHSAFDCGFNFLELGNYAPVDWLPYGHMAVELGSGLAVRACISPDKLMVKAANEAVKALWKLSLLRKNDADPNLHKWKSVAGKDGILVKSLRSRILWIESRRKYLCDFSQTKMMDSNFDAEGKRECCICHYDIYLSAVGCSCSTGRFTCLNHAKELCACSWRSRVFLFRYSTPQLRLLAEALEGKLSAIYRWGKSSLGLLVHSHVNPPVRDH